MGIEFNDFGKKMLLLRWRFESVVRGEGKDLLHFVFDAGLASPDRQRQIDSALVSFRHTLKRLADIVVIYGADDQSFRSMEEALGGERSR